jgi:biotin carboxyl carrier protein
MADVLLGPAALELFQGLVADLALETGQEPSLIATRLARVCRLVAHRTSGQAEREDLSDVETPSGEHLGIPDRIVVAPALGRFRPLPRGQPSLVATVVRPGDVLGFVEGFRCSTAISTPFSGLVAGMLALPGEHLTKGQPVAWLRPA